MNKFEGRVACIVGNTTSKTNVMIDLTKIRGILKIYFLKQLLKIPQEPPHGANIVEP